MDLNPKEIQYRAELFDRFLLYLLQAKYKSSEVHSNVRFRPDQTSPQIIVDFAVFSTNDPLTLIESKVTSSQPPSNLSRTFAQLEWLVDRLELGKTGARIILAAAFSLTPSAELQGLELTASFQKRSVSFEIWDETQLLHFSKEYLGLSLDSLSTNNLLTALEQLDPPKSGPAHKRKEKKNEDIFKEGEYSDVTVLCADFCSYSKFVHGSQHDQTITISIMSRFYREARRIISEHGGILDKFMGDGLLAFWPAASDSSLLTVQIDSCVRDLIGTALSIAKEWQGQIDLAVSPVGIKAGAARGRILFISEDMTGSSHLHAIGEAINIAARLQSIAEPNYMVVSNRLRSGLFGEDPTFEELTPQALKNIGDILAWKKCYAETRTK